MVEVVGERGFAGCTVEAVAARARVSRRTFYGCFDDLRDCFLAVLDQGTEWVIGIISQAFVGRESWMDGLRWALASLLMFLDSEPMLARVWLVESMAAGGWALEHREHRLRDILSVIRDAWPLPDSLELRPLVIEGIYASVEGLVVQRVIAGDAGSSLIDLLGPLMGLIAAPFLGDDSAQHEIEIGDGLAQAITANGSRSLLSRMPEVGGAHTATGWPEEALTPALPAVLSNPRAHRARLCVLFLAEHSGSSNSQVAAGIGISRRGQISALLARLARDGLVLKTACGLGRPNEWRLSPDGEKATAVLCAATASYCAHAGRVPFPSSNS